MAVRMARMAVRNPLEAGKGRGIVVKWRTNVKTKAQEVSNFGGETYEKGKRPA
jgi:hypothetical protein